MTDTWWRQHHNERDEHLKLLRVKGQDDLWALGPVDIGGSQWALVVLAGPSWRAAQLLPWAKPGEEWWVAGLVIDLRLSTEGFYSLREDVCTVVEKGKHLRLHGAKGVNMKNVGNYESFQKGQIAAQRWVQASIPEDLRKHVAALYAPPTSEPSLV